MTPRRKPAGLASAGREVLTRVRAEIDRALIRMIARFSEVESRVDEIDARLAVLEARR